MPNSLFGENPLHLFDPTHQRFDVGAVAVRREARAGGRLDAEPAHQGLRAMVAGADGDARIVQYGGGVVRVHPIDVEADDPGAVPGPVNGDAADITESVTAFGDERAFMGVNRVERKL